MTGNAGLMRSVVWLALVGPWAAAAFEAVAGEPADEARPAEQTEEPPPAPMDAARAQELLAKLAADDIDAAMAAADEFAAAGAGALPCLLRARSTDDERTRERIAGILGRIRHPDALAALHAMLRDESEAVQREAIAGIGSQGRAESVSVLKPFLVAKDPRVRLQTAMALGRIGRSDESARSSVLALLRLSSADDDHRIRKAAVVGMGLLNHPAAIPVLIMRLRDENATVRTLAHLFLKKLSGVEFDYCPTDDIAWREEAIRKWEAWWKSQESATGGDTGKKQEVQK